MKKYFKYLGWSLVIGTSIYFFLNIVLPYFTSNNHFTKDMIPFKTSFILHFIAGTVMLSFGPLQFISKIRKKVPKVHRMIGRTYVICVVISDIVASYIAIDKMIITEGLFTFGTGLLFLALSSLLATLTAFWMVRNRNFAQHKEWMIRSYVLTLAFVTFRIFSVTLNDSLLHMKQLDILNIMSWASWSVPLFITEFFLQFKKTHKQTVRVSESII